MSVLNVSGGGSARTRKLQAILGEGLQTPGTAKRALEICCSQLYHSKARELWSSMPADWKTQESYAAMIHMCKRLVHLQEAEVLFREMQRASLKPSFATQTLMIGIYTTLGQLDNAVSLFEEMCVPPAGAIALKPKELAEVQAAYAAVMKAIAKAGNYEKVRELFTRMTGADWSTHTPPSGELSIPPLRAHFHALLVSCAATGDFKRTEAIFNAMSNWGSSPLVGDYNVFMECCKGDLPLCTRLITEMRRRGIKPSGRTYSASFAALGQAPCSRKWRGADFRGPVTGEGKLGRREAPKHKWQATPLNRREALEQQQQFRPLGRREALEQQQQAAPLGRRDAPEQQRQTTPQRKPETLEHQRQATPLGRHEPLEQRETTPLGMREGLDQPQQATPMRRQEALEQRQATPLGMREGLEQPRQATPLCRQEALEQRQATPQPLGSLRRALHSAGTLVARREERPSFGTERRNSEPHARVHTAIPKLTRLPALLDASATLIRK